VADGSVRGLLHLLVAVTVLALGAQRTSIGMYLAVVVVVVVLRVVVHGSRAKIVGTVTASASAMTVALREREMTVGIEAHAVIGRGIMIAGMEGEIGGVGDWRVIATNLVVPLLLVLMVRIKRENAIASLERGVVRGARLARGVGIGDAMIGRGADGGAAHGAVAGIDVADKSRRLLLFF
jgi:hypothetical protein